MSNFNKRRSRGLEKVLYILAAAIILIVLATLLILGFRDNPSNETEVTTAGKILPVEDDSKNNDKAKADQAFQEAAGKSINSAKEGASGAAEVEDKDTTNESQSGSDMPWFLISVITLTTVANGCIAIFIFRYIRESIKLQRERIKLLSDSKYVEPEDLQKTMRDLSENTKALDKQLSELKQSNQDTLQQLMYQAKEAFTKAESNSASNLKNVEELKSSYLLMRDALDEKDKEIKRYKEGYDTDKLIKSLEGFILIRDRIYSYAEDGKTTPDDLKNIVKIIESNITIIGAKEIEITIGDNIDDDKYLNKFSVKKEVDTDNSDDDGKIASIEKIGYQVKGPETNTVIRKAEITLYKYKTNE